MGCVDGTMDDFQTDRCGSSMDTLGVGNDLYPPGGNGLLVNQ